MNLAEKHRPKRIADLAGQDFAVKRLSAFVRKPEPCAFLFSGDTGTGKTSAAYALARELGCLVEHAELGGINEIASGEQTADSVRGVLMRCCYRPFFGSGWKVLIVNECDQMSKAAEVIWLDALEHVPPSTVIVFTTNAPEKLSPRFRDRCEGLEFESDFAKLRDSARSLVAKIWKQETGQLSAPQIPLDKVVIDGRISFRRLVQHLAPIIATV